jgi:uncharacterized protein (DUF952 family)
VTTTLLHIATAAAWATAREQGQYVPEAFATEGFVHCSEPEQVVRVANSRFVGRTDLVLLWINVARLAARVVYENLEGGDEVFPHVYGPINLDAVVAVTPFRPDADGRFSLSQVER